MRRAKKVWKRFDREDLYSADVVFVAGYGFDECSEILLKKCKLNVDLGECKEEIAAGYTINIRIIETILMWMVG